MNALRYRVGTLELAKTDTHKSRGTTPAQTSQRKVCMLGTYAVGKTSLVARFVKGIFSEKYLTTVGVRIDMKAVSVGEREVKIILWDIEGQDEYQKLRTTY